MSDVHFAVPRSRCANSVHVFQKEETARREFREKSAQCVAVGGRDVEDVDVQVEAPCQRPVYCMTLPNIDVKIKGRTGAFAFT